MPRPPAPVHGLEEWVIFGAIAYEIAAKVSQYLPGPTLPTITALNRREPLVGKAVVKGLQWHFRT